MEKRGRKPDSWDTLVEKAIDSLQSPYILRGIDWRRLRRNRPPHNTVAKFEALATWDLWDKPSASS